MKYVQIIFLEITYTQRERERASREAPGSPTERNGSIGDKYISKQPKIVCNMAKAMEQVGEQVIRTR